MTVSNISSKATGPVVIRFHVEPSGAGGKKIHSNHPGRMTNVATTTSWADGRKVFSNSPGSHDQHGPHAS